MDNNKLLHTERKQDTTMEERCSLQDNHISLSKIEDANLTLKAIADRLKSNSIISLKEIFKAVKFCIKCHPKDFCHLQPNGNGLPVRKDYFLSLLMKLPISELELEDELPNNFTVQEMELLGRSIEDMLSQYEPIFNGENRILPKEEEKLIQISHWIVNLTKTLILPPFYKSRELLSSFQSIYTLYKDFNTRLENCSKTGTLSVPIVNPKKQYYAIPLETSESHSGLCKTPKRVNSEGSTPKGLKSKPNHTPMSNSKVSSSEKRKNEIHCKLYSELQTPVINKKTKASLQNHKVSTTKKSKSKSTPLNNCIDKQTGTKRSKMDTSFSQDNQKKKPKL